MNVETSLLNTLPLSFQINQGQSSSDVKFLAKCSGYDIFLANDEIVFLSKNPTKGTDINKENPSESIVRIKFGKANKNTQVIGLEKLPGKFNYLKGNVPSKWITSILTFAKVKYSEIYPGMDMVCYGSDKQLEYDFIVYPGACPDAITLDFEGCSELTLDKDGNLILPIGSGQITMHKPLVYQKADGTRKEVEGRFKISRNSRVSFELGKYDTSRPLVIDPALTYSTYLGGKATDYGYDIAVDLSGCAYMVGNTTSTDFPTENAYQSENIQGYDVVVTKLNASGSALVYSTYIGGIDDDYGYGIAVDSSGSAYVAGCTKSEDFPTQNPYQSSFGGGSYDAIVIKLNASGNSLVYSTYLGGKSDDYGYDIAVDSSGYAYVTGYTSSTDFPYKNAYQSSNAGSIDIFVTKLNASGSALVYSTYIGGTGDDYGRGIAIDSSGSAYISGYANSTNFPTQNPYQHSFGNGSYDAVIFKLNASGNSLVYSTYLGGTGADYGRGIAVDSSGSAYVIGYTNSTNFPTEEAYQSNNAGGYDVFVTKLNASGNILVYSTYIGGTGTDYGCGITINSSGCAYVIGYTNSTNFPVKEAYQSNNAGGYDVFVTKLNVSGSTSVYSTYIGGTGTDYGYGIVVDSSGCAYVTGYTNSTNFPLMNAYQHSIAGISDIIILKFTNNNPISRGLDFFKNSGFKKYILKVLT